MKKLNFSFLLFLICLLSCKEEEEPGPFSHIPSGEIVPIADRDELMTGNRGETQEIVKWWRHNFSNVTHPCGYNGELHLLPMNYPNVSFRVDGSIYSRTKTGEEGEDTGKNWSWADANKNAIILDIIPEVQYHVRALNSNTIVLASSRGTGECTIITWEEFTTPVIE